VFVYEYLSAGVDPTLPASLRIEGWAMLRAVIEDLVRVHGVEVHTIVGSEREDLLRGCEVENLGPGGEETAFRRETRQADFTLVLAPESDALLSTRSRWVEEEKGRLLGPASQAVEATADKLALAGHLREHGVRTPSTGSLDPLAFDFPVVCKPRYGAGSQATFLVHDPKHLAACVQQARREGWTGELIGQPFVSGLAASVSFLIGPFHTVALAPAAQHLSPDGRFWYMGGEVPLSPNLCARAVQAARLAVQAVQGLRGYVGVDMVLGDADNGSQDWVIEINPRLTTSYLGLRALAVTNLAEMMLRVVRGEPVGTPAWRGGGVAFRSDGAVIG
jgi:predicted ATP-grasp superfamily ATP-dependent carboligase